MAAFNDGARGQTSPQQRTASVVDQVPIPATPDFNGGIEGQIFLGPMTPVEREGKGNNRPYQATIKVLDDEGRLVTQFESETNGRFRLVLKPGKYLLEPQAKGPWPRAARQVVTVSPEVFTQVSIVYDSGIR